MAGPINPITLAMIGAAGGAALKPNNPLQGALLGATAGYTGGTALGVGAPAAASGGGLTMGAKGVTGLSIPSSTIGSASNVSSIANAANYADAVNASLTAPQLFGLGGTGTTAGLSAVPASTSLIDPVAMGQREAFIGGNYSLSSAAPVPSVANYSLVAPSPVTSPPTPSFMDKVGLSAKSSYENPGQSLAALSATNSLLQPDQQMATAPVVPVTARNQLRPFNPMESMDPYRQSVISNQPISLLG